MINHPHLQHTQRKWPIETGCGSNYQKHYKKKKAWQGISNDKHESFLTLGVSKCSWLSIPSEDRWWWFLSVSQCLPRIPNMFSFHHRVLLKHSDRLNKSVAAEEVFNGRQSMRTGWKWRIWWGIYLRGSPWSCWVSVKTMTPTYKEGLCVADLTVKK